MVIDPVLDSSTISALVRSFFVAVLLVDAVEVAAIAEMPDVAGAIPRAAIIAIAPNLSNTSFFFIFLDFLSL